MECCIFGVQLQKTSFTKLEHIRYISKCLYFIAPVNKKARKTLRVTGTRRKDDFIRLYNLLL